MFNHLPDTTTTRHSFPYEEAKTNTRRALILFMLSVIARNSSVRDVQSGTPTIPHRNMLGYGLDTLMQRYYRAAVIDVVSISNALPDDFTFGDVIGIVASDIAHYLHHTPAYTVPEDSTEYETYRVLRYVIASSVARRSPVDDLISVTPYGWQMGRIASVGCGQAVDLMMDCADFRAHDGHLFTPAPCFVWGEIPREPRWTPVVDLAEIAPVMWASDLAHYLTEQRYEARTDYRFGADDALWLPAPGKDMPTDIELYDLVHALTTAVDDTVHPDENNAPSLWHDLAPEAEAEGWTLAPKDYVLAACTAVGLDTSWRSVAHAVAVHVDDLSDPKDLDAATRAEVSPRWFITPRLWLDRYRAEAGDFVRDHYDDDYDYAEAYADDD
ncbi:hypothetical protein [Corynebacterium sp. HMSC05E07]|uniref:hypothetical protein n=1 Tax=Corynebacterium sp. HMSC05E07 TaxID=1581117 RepID=UPI0008A52B07|nr:hypothetical protein [Corynebacterium sp. HMSC05E07]OFT59862.1 hypothetical protein HMPREF3149_09250 [Corynebacterium sp. HMSC05E07]